MNWIATAILVAFATWGAGCATTQDYFQDAGAPPPSREYTLADWPYKEIWSGIVFNGGKIGFTRLSISPAPDAPQRWDIESEAAIRLRFLGIDKRINLHSRDRVRADLTLERFEYAYDLDGSALDVRGESDGKNLALRVRASGASEDRKILLSASLYPQSAITLVPVMRGMWPGRTLRFLVLQGETQQVAVAEQKILGWERSPLFDGSAFKIDTQLLGVDTTTWIGADGRPVFELALHGTMISALETEPQAKSYLVAATLNKTETLLDFSLLKAGPIDDARLVSRLEIEFSGVPSSLAVPSGGQQICTRENTRLRCSVDRALADGNADPALLRTLLAPTLVAPSTDGQIVALARSIAAGAANAGEKLTRILAWIDANIAKEAIDAFTAVDVLRERRAECQGHAALTAALARALAIPIRVVNGVVYSEQHGGFLYHTWNEAWIEGRGWQALDPTLNQLRADATHIKLIEGESLAELVPLVGMVGKARVESVRALARW
ncbi:MAG TPA: transglutaminase-like domain-containing protein [Burkholderiales bacterium]|nr:transglutaminase-like domain-containing protein [Burkholderiales bacterium]